MTKISSWKNKKIIIKYRGFYIKIFLIVAVFIISITTARCDWGIFSGIILTTPANAITLTGALSGGVITLQPWDLAVTQKGVCWDLSLNPTTSLTTKTQDGACPVSGNLTYISTMTGLTSGTIYHVRANVTNGDGTFYGDDRTFTTIPTLPEWGLISMLGLFAVAGGWFVWKKMG